MARSVAFTASSRVIDMPSSIFHVDHRCLFQQQAQTARQLSFAAAWPTFDDVASCHHLTLVRLAIAQSSRSSPCHLVRWNNGYSIFNVIDTRRLSCDHGKRSFRWCAALQRQVKLPVAPHLDVFLRDLLCRSNAVPSTGAIAAKLCHASSLLSPRPKVHTNVPDVQPPCALIARS